MANLKNTTIDDTGFLKLPTGTSDQRPEQNPRVGAIRFNTETNKIELWNGSSWAALGI